MRSNKIGENIEVETNSSIERKKSFLNWILLACVSVGWGSADILAKKGLVIFAPNEVGIMRMFVASLVFTPLALARVGKVKFRELMQYLFIGLVGSVLPAFLFARSQAKLDSWLNTVLNSLTPIMTLLLARFLFKRHISRNEIIGMIISCVGTVLLISGVMGAEHSNIQYIIFALLGALCYAVSTNFIGVYMRNENIFTATAISLLPYSVIMGVFLFTQTSVLYKLQNVEGAYRALIFVISLSLCSSVFAFLIFNVLTKSASPVFASMSALIAPIISLGWGMLDGERLGVIQCFGIFTILVGVYILNRQGSK